LENNVQDIGYASIMRSRIAAGEITWQYAFDWLQQQGMSARSAKRVLGAPQPLQSRVSLEKYRTAGVNALPLPQGEMDYRSGDPEKKI